jgi:hypothetical protein
MRMGHIAGTTRRRLGARFDKLLLHLARVARSRPQSRRQHRWSMMKQFLAEEAR